MATFTWVGGSALWGDPGAWTPVGTPGLADTAIFNTGAVVTGKGSVADELLITAVSTGVTIDGSIGVGTMSAMAPLVIVTTGTLSASQNGHPATDTVGIDVQGTLISDVDNSGAISVSGLWSGAFTNEASGDITDDGVYNGAGKFETNHGFISIGGTFNAGTLTNTNTVSVTGTLTGAVVNSGLLNAGGAHFDLSLLREGGSDGGSGAAPPGTAKMFLSIGSIVELDVGYNPVGPSAASSLTLDQTTLTVGMPSPGVVIPFVVGQAPSRSPSQARWPMATRSSARREPQPSLSIIRPGPIPTPSLPC